MKFSKALFPLLILSILVASRGKSGAALIDCPAVTVKLVFIHHSTGGNWLADPNDDRPYGELGRALKDNNYFVSATNYGWGPESIGDRTDIPNWPEWFTGENCTTYLDALYGENAQNVHDPSDWRYFGAWPRLSADPGGQNEIILFKSCFPNSNLDGNPNDAPLDEPNEQYTVENAKAVYNDILAYFETRQDKLFVVITAPPLIPGETSSHRAANARAFNNWLVNDWLDAYAHENVAVFDYYNVLTSGDNHHRWHNGAIEHVINTASNTAYYPSGDSHPSTAGHQKATEEFVPLLNVFYNKWKSAGSLPVTAPTGADLVTVLRIVSGNQVDGPASQGDADGDGKLSLRDAVFILRQLAGFAD
jgi:hypothetical protein